MPIVLCLVHGYETKRPKGLDKQIFERKMVNILLPIMQFKHVF